MILIRSTCLVLSLMAGAAWPQSPAPAPAPTPAPAPAPAPVASDPASDAILARIVAIGKRMESVASGMRDLPSAALDPAVAATFNAQLDVVEARLATAESSLASKVPPTPQTPTAPVAVPPAARPAVADVFGLKAFTGQLIAGLPLGFIASPQSDPATKADVPRLAAVFADAADHAASHANAQELSDSTAAAVRAAVGARYQSYWKPALLGPLQSRWSALNLRGKLLTTSELAQAYREISAALSGVN